MGVQLQVFGKNVCEIQFFKHSSHADPWLHWDHALQKKKKKRKKLVSSFEPGFFLNLVIFKINPYRE